MGGILAAVITADHPAFTMAAWRLRPGILKTFLSGVTMILK